jgi:hypothetical protein
MQTPEDAVPIPLPRALVRHWFAAAVTAVVLAVALPAAAARPLWLDEILTYHVLKGGSLGDLWHRLATGTQSDPPLFYLAARLSTGLLGDSPLTFRLPSVLGIVVMALALYAFVARRCPLAYARLALLLALFPPVLGHLANARPYGLWLGCSGLCLLCWQIAGDTSGWRRRAALVGLAACSAASVASHYYAVLFLAALGLAELFRSWQARRLDVPVWFGLGVAVVPLVACRPLIENAKSFITDSWAPPTLTDPNHGLLGVLQMLFADRPRLAVFLVTALVVVLHRLRHGRSGTRPAPVPGATATLLAAGAAVAAIPFLGFVLARCYTNNYEVRYVLPAVCGLAVLVPVAACRLAGARALPGHLLVAVTAALFAYLVSTHVERQPNFTLARVWGPVREADGRARASGTFLVTSRLHTFVETRFYHPEVRLLYVCLERHASTNEMARRLRPWYDGILEPEQLEDLDRFLVVEDTDVSGATMVRLVRDGELPSVPLSPLSGGQAVYLVRGARVTPPAALGR